MIQLVVDTVQSFSKLAFRTPPPNKKNGKKNPKTYIKIVKKTFPNGTIFPIQCTTFAQNPRRLWSKVGRRIGTSAIWTSGSV